MNQTQKKIRKIALSFLDERELDNNSGFEVPKFQQLMEMVGWRKWQAWCAYFAELVWQQAGQESATFSGSAVQTFRNFDELGRTSQLPEVGDVVIWQNYGDGKPKWTGHAGIVVLVKGKYIVTVEGNTNGNGGREGIEVAMKLRDITLIPRDGIRVMGFIKPKEIL